MKGFNKNRMSAYNRIVVMRAFYNRNHLAIHSLAGEMELAIPTISTIFKELEQRGFIRQAQVEHTGRGRHQGFWTLNKEKEHFITMEVSPYQVKGLVVDASGSPKSKIARISKPFSSARGLIEGCISLINLLKKQADPPIRRCALGIHGVVNYNDGVSVLLPKLFYKEETPFRAILQEATGCGIKVDNDCNTKALAEKWLGGAQGVDNFIWLNLDYGIGAALVLSGDLFRGNKFTAGQIGHVQFSGEGPLCSCGSKGCLEALFSSKVLLSKFRMAWENSPYELESPSGQFELNDFFLALQKGHPVAQGVFMDSAPHLGRALVALVNIVSPECVYLGGKLCGAGSPLIEYLRAYLKSNSIYRSHDSQELLFSELSEEQMLAGAAFLWLEEELAPN